MNRTRTSRSGLMIATMAFLTTQAAGQAQPASERRAQEEAQRQTAAAASSAAPMSLYKRLALEASERRLGLRGNERVSLDQGMLEAISTYHVAPPEPPTFEKHDLVTIIVNERSSTSNEQTLETERESEIDSRFNALLDVSALLNGELLPGATTNVTLADLESDSEWTGEGEAETENTFEARITAEVIDVKPNGTLVIEATRRVMTDDLENVITLTGVVRTEDISEDNEVLSSQIADLELKQEQSGEVRDAAKKGIVAKVLEAIFSF